MPTFETDAAGLLWDATAVSNAFLCEFMPAAPDLYVKVYLYGLMYAHSGLSDQEGMLADLAQALAMPMTDVEKALRYWERCRLVERTRKEPPGYRFLSVQQMFLLKQQSPQDNAYESFAQAVYAAFGDRRKLHGGETVLAYEWVEDLRLPAEVVLMLIQHMINTRGIQFSFQAAQKVAVDMAQLDVRTVEAAEGYFARSEAARQGARTVLRRLGGKGREPSDDEMDLYVKWTGPWGFEPKAVLAACAETPKGSPTFGYLDGILKRLYEQKGGQTVSGKKMAQTLAQQNAEGDSIKKIMHVLGKKIEVVDEGMRLAYRDLCRFGPDMALLAAQAVGRTRSVNGHTLDQVAEVLNSWEAKGLTDVQTAQAYLQEVEGLNQRIRGWMEKMDRKGGCTDANRTLLRRWQNDWHMPDELMDLAAEYAADSERPMPYMDKLLSSWRDAHITSVAAARENHDQFVRQQKNQPAPGKRVVEQQYEQRVYDPKEFEGLSAAQMEELNRQ
ncbi:MAG: DnaD domain protein [Clostridiales bacterium]|nr:DnaD domain protein [Clostridiales bacterium]